MLFSISSCIPDPIKKGPEKTKLEYSDDLVTNVSVDTFGNNSNSSQDTNSDNQISKAEIQFYEVLRTNCFSCHNKGSAYGNLNISVSDLVYGGYIFPGKPDDSKLYYRLNGSGVSQGRGLENMPVGTLLDNIDRQHIYEFIESVDASSLDQPTTSTDSGSDNSSSNDTTSSNSTISDNNALIVLKNYCISCHTGYHDKWKNFSDQDYITQGLIQPGKPEASLLINITKYNPYTDVQLMPKSDNGFTETHFNTLEDWVKALGNSGSTSSSNSSNSNNNDTNNTAQNSGQTNDQTNEQQQVVNNTQTAKQILQTYCTSCHTGYHNAWNNYTDQDFINRGLAIPGSPQTSPILRITKHNPYTGISLMPKVNNGFEAGHYQILDDWIKAMQTP